MAERRWSDHKGFHIDVIGHQLLGPVSTNAALPVEGCRTSNGVFVMSPDALGERLELLSQQYEQHVVKKLKVVYRPSVPSTTAGAIAIYFRNDPNTPMDITGVDELSHASTHPSFVQTQVWQPVELDIKPSDATTKYFSTDTGDARFQVQGIVTVESASPLPEASVYGNLFLEYEISFSGEELDYEVADVSSGQFDLNWNAFTPSGVGAPISAVMQAASPSNCSGSFTAGSPPPNTQYLLYGTISAITGNPPPVQVAGSAEAKTFAVGQGIFARFMCAGALSNNFTDGTVFAVFFYDLASAIEFQSSEGFVNATAGMLAYNLAGPFPAGDVIINWRTYQLTYD